MLVTFSYLMGCDLFHKIAVTSKKVRSLLLESALLDQNKVLTIKGSYKPNQVPKKPPGNSFAYAMEFSTAIVVQIEVASLDQLNDAESIYNKMQQFASLKNKNKLTIDFSLKYKTIETRIGPYYYEVGCDLSTYEYHDEPLFQEYYSKLIGLQLPIRRI